MNLQQGDYVRFDGNSYGWFWHTNIISSVVITSHLPNDKTDDCVHVQNPKFVERSDFVWAVWKMYFGFKVTRKRWNNQFHVARENNYLAFISQYRSHLYTPNWEDLVATDWEVVS